MIYLTEDYTDIESFNIGVEMLTEDKKTFKSNLKIYIGKFKAWIRAIFNKVIDTIRKWLKMTPIVRINTIVVTDTEADMAFKYSAHDWEPAMTFDSYVSDSDDAGIIVTSRDYIEEVSTILKKDEPDESMRYHIGKVLDNCSDLLVIMQKRTAEKWDIIANKMLDRAIRGVPSKAVKLADVPTIEITGTTKLIKMMEIRDTDAFASKSSVTKMEQNIAKLTDSLIKQVNDLYNDNIESLSTRPKSNTLVGAVSKKIVHMIKLEVERGASGFRFGTQLDIAKLNSINSTLAKYKNFKSGKKGDS